MAHLDEIVEGLFEARMNFIGEVPYEGEKRMRKKVTQLMACVLVVLLIMTLLPELSGGKAYALHHQHSGCTGVDGNSGDGGAAKVSAASNCSISGENFSPSLMVRFTAINLQLN
ncbi:hypothetical protein [Paenibacillus terrigena]|uniref:hypothetical protein n=1 Tax=Paenibacillus terrigena TaxID=369333 RepID=UPI0012EB91A8|nr:hypothetical protein [Paenibacillus terrigena]